MELMFNTLSYGFPGQSVSTSGLVLVKCCGEQSLRFLLCDLINMYPAYFSMSIVN